MASTAPAMNPNPPKFVTGAQIKAARALLGWRRLDLAAAAGLHRNAVAYWERQQRMPRAEPCACRKMRAALLAAGVVTVSRPAPGICLLGPGQRQVSEPTLTPVSSPEGSEGDGGRSIRASGGPELCTMHSGLAVTTAQEQPDGSTPPGCDRSTEPNEADA